MTKEKDEENVLKNELEALYQRVAGNDDPEGKREQIEDLTPCYSVLHVGPAATMEEITAAYEKLMHTWHEDNYLEVPLWKETAREKRREIRDAYEKILSFRQYASAGKIQEKTNQEPPAPAFLSSESEWIENLGNVDNLENAEEVKDDRQVEPPASRNVSRLLAGAALAAITAFALLYWPSLYHYDSIKSGDKVFPLRINRLTAATTYFNGQEWVSPPVPDQRVLKAKEQPAPLLPQALPPAVSESLQSASAPSAPVERKPPVPLENEKVKRITTKGDQGVAAALKETSAEGEELRLTKSAPAAPSEPKKPQKSSSADRTGPEGVYSIQIRAFQDGSKAKAFLREVKGDKGSMRIQKTVQKDNKIWYRVLIGRFKNRNEAVGYLQKKKIQETYPGSFIQHTGKI